MKIVFLDPIPLKGILSLSAEEDTLFVLPQACPEVAVDLEMKKPGVKAFLFGLFKNRSSDQLFISQTHHAEETESRVFLKAALEAGGKFLYHGKLHIKARALHARASQEARGLLLEENSSFRAVPSLEILPAEVTCSHKASAGPVNSQALFALQTRGLDENEAKAVLEKGFFQSAFETLQEWGLSTDEREKIKTAFSSRV